MFKRRPRETAARGLSDRVPLGRGILHRSMRAGLGAAVLLLAVGMGSLEVSSALAQAPLAEGRPPQSPLGKGGSSARAQAPPAEEEPAQPPTTQASPPPSQSDTPPRTSVLDLDLEQLSQISVVPSAGQRAPTATATGSVFAPTQADISVSEGVGELLERSASVSLRRTTSINLDPRIRGLHAGQLNGSSDGVTQIKTRLDIDSLFSQVDPSLVGNVTVYDGPYTALHGPGLAFLLADLTPVERSSIPEFHGSALLSHGTNGRQITSSNKIWGSGRDWGFLGSYGLRVGNDYRAGRNSGDDRIASSYHTQDVFFAASLDILPRWRSDVTYTRQDVSDFEIPGVVYDITRQQTDEFNVRFSFRPDANGPDRFVAQAWSNRTPYFGDSSHPSKTRSFYSILIAGSEPGLLGGLTTADGVSQSSGVRSYLSFGEPDELLWTVGADWRRYQQRYVETDFAADGSVFFGGSLFGIPDSSQENAGLFTELKIVPSSRTTLTMGGRIDRVRSSVDPNDTVVVQQDDPLFFYRPGVETPTDYLGLAFGAFEYKPADLLIWSAGVGFAMRPPTLAELYSDEPYVPIARFGNSFVDGDSGLEPEKALQFDLGARIENERVRFGAKAFYNHINDYILSAPSNFSTFTPAGAPAPTNLLRDYTFLGADPSDPSLNFAASNAQAAYQYANIDSASLYGGEIQLGVDPSDWLTLRGVLAYVRGTNHAPVAFDEATRTFTPAKSSEGLPGVYPFNSTLAVEFHEPSDYRWTLGFIVRMVNGQNFVADSLGELPTPGFATLSINASYRLSERVRLFAAAENVFDRTYAEHGSLVIVRPDGSLGFVRAPGLAILTGIEARF